LKTIVKIAIRDPTMIVCVCRAVSESRVSECIAGGASDVAEVTRRCGAGADCGACVMDIEAHLSESSVRRIGVAA
jgi:bacterioferritin-associated ferredoxin